MFEMLFTWELWMGIALGAGGATLVSFIREMLPARSPQYSARETARRMAERPVINNTLINEFKPAPIPVTVAAPRVESERPEPLPLVPLPPGNKSTWTAADILSGRYPGGLTAWTRHNAEMPEFEGVARRRLPNEKLAYFRARTYVEWLTNRKMEMSAE